MKDYRPQDSFDQAAADIYDRDLRGDEQAATEFLAELAGAGPALELAVGTGRIAIPLAATGVRLAGIDFSEPMLAKLRAKPGGERIEVTVGDFAEVAVEGSFRLIYLVFNTLFNLLGQDDQVRCFRNVARHLTADGVFVVEAFTPGYLYRLREHQYVDAEDVQGRRITLDVGRHDPVSQTLTESHVVLTPEHGVRLYPIVTRYAWPSELDLMARIAGLRLRERWGDWRRGEFTADSRLHVSVYERDEPTE
ncbi:MAG TPA: class I SAM-dependent methyltransferase [Jatrophihabitans sp.]|nr:class I SAM-dependent methyltransferase [Jatrophihabitans sp.]